MQYLRTASAVICIAILAGGAAAQPAANEYEAAATMRTYVFTADGIAKHCSRAYPALATQIDRDLATWKRNDKAAIARAEAIWQYMRSASPRPPQEERSDREQLERLWKLISVQQPGESPDAPQSRCTRYFHERANGILRVRAPDVFQRLEAP